MDGGDDGLVVGEAELLLVLLVEEMVERHFEPVGPHLDARLKTRVTRFSVFATNFE